MGDGTRLAQLDTEILLGRGRLLGAVDLRRWAACNTTFLRALDLPVDVIGTSDGWGVEKPSAALFGRVVAEAGCAVDQVLHVGDQLDNDIRPAQDAGIATALVRRGPWGHILDDKIVSERCLFRLDSLAELPALVRKHYESAA